MSGGSYYRRNGEVALLHTTIGDHFAAIVEKYGEREAVVSRPQQRRLTYRQLQQQVDRLARALLGLGYQKGDRVGIWSTNNIEWLLLQLATARIGVILVNINPAYRSSELAYALQCSEVQGLFCIPAFRHSNYIEMLEALTADAEALPLLRHIVVYDPFDPDHTEKPSERFTPWAEALAFADNITEAQLEAAASVLDCHDPINIQYTSGTTGHPKAVLLTHHNILNNAWFSAQAMHFSERDRLCVPVPFYHCFGMVLANLLCMSVGACNVIACEHFDAEAVLKAVEAERCTALHGVPTMFIALLEQPDFQRYDLSTLRTGIMAGAPCPPVLMHDVINKLHCREILIGYGETEASPLTHLTDRDDDLTLRTETVGRNLPHQEVKVVNLEAGETVPLGEAGEVCFRGYHIMQGYYGNQEATAKAIDDDGWLHSGDIGVMDENGYLRITGRLKEMIIRGGENIYPKEVEELLFEHPAIAEAAVFGVPDDYYGEEIAVWIQLHSGQDLSEQQVRDYCRDKIARFKIPKYIRFVDEFPMTVTGKLQKFKMRERELEMLSGITR